MDIAEFLNKLVESFEGGNPVFGSLYRIATFGNEASLNTEVKSTTPIKVLFPHKEMGSYGDLKPFDADESLTKSVSAGTIDIGGILLGTDYIKETYRGFVEENATNVPFKNITKLVEAFAKGVNVATAEPLQFNARV